MRIFKKILLTTLIVIIAIVAALFLVMSRGNVSRSDLEEAYFTDNSEYMDVNVTSLSGETLPINVHVQDHGDPLDPVIVLIHGAFSSSHTFEGWLDALLSEGYRVIMPDLPYFGLSEGFLDNVTSYRRSAEVVKAVLDAKGITSVHIAGNSLGGAVSWFFASAYPEMTQSVTLIDAVHPSLEQNGRDQVGRIARIGFVADVLSTFTPRFLMGALLRTAYGDPENLEDDVLDRYYDIIRKEGTRKAILTSVQEEEPSFTYEERLQSLSMPVYVMWGEKDTWIPVDTVALFQTSLGISDENIVIYPDLGHVPMEEDPRRTVTDYITFLEAS
jgi:pimeloyl-ACP methyl ester carboxylesterase